MAFKDLRKSALLLFLVVTLAAGAFAADVSARIRGTVTDPSGAAVPNLAITATNQQTGVVYSATTQADGSYQFLRLPVGTYSVSTEPSGFQKFKASNITLVIDQQYVQNIQLKVGNTTETVDVTANPVQVDTTNIQKNYLVDAQQAVDLPLIGRNFTQLELLFPGVQASSDRFGTFSVNGSQTQQTSFLVNGTDINDAPLNTAVVIPSPDAVQEFSLVTSSLNPEYSRNSGGIVSVNIKNGTNKFHGGAFDFYRDTFLNTANFFQNKCHTHDSAGNCNGPGASVFHQNIFGGTVGGPVIKDKAFFFLSYQGTRARTPDGIGNTLVPTAAQRGGDFSASTLNAIQPGTGTDPVKNPPIPAYIPSTLVIPGCTTGNGGDTWASCGAKLGKNFAGAINPISAKLLNAFVPLPTSGNRFLFNPITTQRTDQGIMRFDLTPTQNNSIYFVGIFQHSPSQDDLPFTGANLPGFPEHAERETHQFTASLTHTFSPTLLNEFRAGYTRFNFGAVLPVNSIDPTSFGLGINVQPPASNLQLPVISVQNSFTIGFSTNGPQPRVDQTYQFDDNLTKVAGNHTLKFGWDGRRFNVDNPFFNNIDGSYGFNASTNPFTSGDANLDFLLGNTASYAQGSGAIINAVAYENYFYGQDQWKARPNLTVTLGAGWQIDTPWNNKQFGGIGVTCYIPGQQSTVFPTAPVGLSYPGDPGCNNGTGSKTTWKHVGPRIGFAYAPSLGFLSDGDSHKLSIRAGYGIYFNRTEEEGSLQNLEDPPFGQNSGGIADLGGIPQFANPFADINGGFTPPDKDNPAGQSIGATSIPNKFPFTFPTAGSSPDFSVFEPFGLSQYSPNYTMPYSQNFNLTIERELPSNIIASVAYVGALARHNQITTEGNPITQAGHDACLANPSCITNRTLQGFFFPTHTLNGNGNIFGSVGLIASGGSSNYNSLQLSARKGFTHGLTFQASYTYSHALDNGSSFENSGFGGSARGYNAFVPSLNYGDSQFDVRHRFVFSPIYLVPNWKNAPGLHWLPDVIGKGWKVTGITTLATGQPFDIRQTGSNSLFCTSGLQFYVCPEVPLQIGQFQMTDPRQPQNLLGTVNNDGKFYFFNPNGVVQNEPIGSFGNIHRNPLHGPGLENTDMTIEKDIYFLPGNENVYMALRLESYNVFNHTNFNNPSSTPTFGGNNLISTASTFGQITGAAPGRQSQIAVKIYF